MNRNAIYTKYSSILQGHLDVNSKILELEGAIANPKELTHPAEILKKNFIIYVSTDVSSQLKEVKEHKKIDCVVVDSRILPFKNKTFDLVHVTFPARVPEFRYKGKTINPTFSGRGIPKSAAEIQRVLKEDGLLVIFPFFKYKDDLDEFWQNRISKTFISMGFKMDEKEVYPQHSAAIFTVVR